MVGLFCFMHKQLLKLAVPNVLTNLSVPLVSMVDLGLMGRMPSASYILAIGFGTMLFNFLYWAFGFLRMGTTGMVSQAFGRGEKEEAQELLRKGLLIALIGGLALIILQVPLLNLALYIIEPDQGVIEPLKQYFQIRIYAAPATISIYVVTGWLLGMQDARSALFLALIVNGFNAAISYCLVAFAEMGIAGVALGTLSAQILGIFAAAGLILFKHEVNLLAVLKKSTMPKKGWLDFVKVNSNILIRTLCLIFVMSFFKTKAGNIDPILGAANMLLIEFITISAYGIDGFAFAAESLTGKYFGKAKKALFEKSLKVSMLWGIGIALLISIVFWFSGEAILALLTDKRAVIKAALPYFPWLIAAPLVNALAFIWDGIYVGTTASVAMRNAMILATLLIFLPSFYLAKPFLFNHGVWLAFTLFMLSRGVILTLMAKRHIYARLEPN